MAIKQEIEQGKKASINILHNKDNNQLILEIIKKHSLQPTMWYVDSSAIKRAVTHFTDGVMEWVLFFFLESVSQTIHLCAKSCMNVFLSPWVIRGTVSKIEIKRANLTEARACYSSQQQLKELHMLKATHIQNLNLWKTNQFRPKVNFHWLKDITYKENTTLSIWDMLLVCTSPGPKFSLWADP
jgi:hypothetical protein